MRECSVFRLLGRFFWRTIAVILALAAFIVAMELVRAYRLSRQVDPMLGWAFLVAVVAALLVIAYKAFGFIADRRTLFGPPAPDVTTPSFDALKESCEHLVHTFKRLGANPHLDDDLRKHLLQQAYDTDETLGHHPLADDLTRALEAGRTAMGPAIERLRERARRLTRERMAFIVQDLVQPPLPVPSTLILAYHEMALMSDIADTYLGNASLIEHLTVARDAWDAMSEGRFLSIGQNIVSCVQANSPPMDRGIDEVCSALTAMWVTQTAGLVAMLRCECLSEWDMEETVGRIEALTDESIAVMRQVLLDDAQPLLKLKMRHAAAGVDAAAYAKSVIESVTRALDIYSTQIKRPQPGTSPLARRSTIHDEPLASEEATREEAASRRHRKRAPRGMFRVLRTFAQRVKYTAGNPR
jgi:hypothetical protein